MSFNANQIVFSSPEHICSGGAISMARLRCLSVCPSVNFSLKIFSSESTGAILFKFDVNDPWVVVLKVYVFYPPTCIRSQMRLRTVLHRNTMGKNSKIFSSESTGPILFKFDVNDPWVVVLKVYVFYPPTCIRSQMRLCTVLDKNIVGNIPTYSSLKLLV